MPPPKRLFERFSQLKAITCAVFAEGNGQMVIVTYLSTCNTLLAYAICQEYSEDQHLRLGYEKLSHNLWDSYYKIKVLTQADGIV